MTLYERFRELRGLVDAHDVVSRADVDDLLELIEACDELGAFLVTTPINTSRLDRLRKALIAIGAKAP